MKYKIMDSMASVIKKTDNDGKITYIPFDEANTDYQAYLEWLAEGNEVLPPDEVTQ